jgi:hypothetical protein
MSTGIQTKLVVFHDLLEQDLDHHPFCQRPFGLEGKYTAGHLSYNSLGCLQLQINQSSFRSLDVSLDNGFVTSLADALRLRSHSSINVDAVLDNLLGDSFLSAGHGMLSCFPIRAVGLLERGVASKELLTS